jgi:hypothetical protein
MRVPGRMGIDLTDDRVGATLASKLRDKSVAREGGERAIQTVVCIILDTNQRSILTSRVR